MRNLGLAALCLLISMTAGCARPTSGALETAPAAHQDSGRDNSSGGGDGGGSM